MDVPVYHTLMAIGIFTGIVLVFQLLDIGFSYVQEERRIRRILAPINEIRP